MSGRTNLKTWLVMMVFLLDSSGLWPSGIIRLSRNEIKGELKCPGGVK